MNLASVQKPGKYLGNEINIIRKQADLKVALCFPDTYEIGMSHLGLKILYYIINNIPYASAERVFAPWLDFEFFLRKDSLPLTSLEYKRPLKDFDIAGFTLQYELSYTNVLNMLDLGGIPIRSADRMEGFPLIIAGGPCTVNPMPLVPFIDAFVIGDGEEVVGEILEVCSGYRIQDSGFRNKKNLLNDLAKLQGVYVPIVHTGSGQKIKKRIVADLGKAPFPDSPVVPFAPIVHDRIPIEISRGCTRGCRFCQAGMIHRPQRERSLEKVLSLAKQSILNTGYEEISFTSLSTGDYSNLVPLLRGFNDLCSNYPVAISLPSLRVGSISREVLKEIKSIRKTGFTIAPEAGTKRLRDIINKDFTDEEYEETLEKLFSEDWQNIKLYFMIGLPTETQEDINGIIHMAEKALKKGKEITGGRVNINVGVSAFIPKPHTPFQWFGQMPFAELRSRHDFLRKAFKKKGLNFKGQHIELSLLEAVFSRGGGECASLLETAWRLGCRFDGWAESFDFSKWLLAAEKTGINLFDYAARTLDMDLELPWDFIDIGMTKEFLKSEYQKSLKREITPDCAYKCSGCGLTCKTRAQNSEHRTQTPLPIPPPRGGRVREGVIKIRVKFSKTGLMRYLSHREVITTFLRAMRRANIPLLYSEGFHPHPKISFGPPLPVGVEGLNEYFDIELPALANAVDTFYKVNVFLPDGLRVLSASTVTKGKKSLNDFISRYGYEIVIDVTMHNSINFFLGLPSCMIKREEDAVDIRPMVEKAEINNGSLHLTLTDTSIVKVRLYEILKELFQTSAEDLHALSIKRFSLYGYNDRKGWIDPLEEASNGR